MIGPGWAHDPAPSQWKLRGNPEVHFINKIELHVVKPFAPAPSFLLWSMSCDHMMWGTTAAVTRHEPEEAKNQLLEMTELEDEKSLGPWTPSNYCNNLGAANFQIFFVPTEVCGLSLEGRHLENSPVTKLPAPKYDMSPLLQILPRLPFAFRTEFKLLVMMTCNLAPAGPLASSLTLLNCLDPSQTKLLWVLYYPISPLDFCMC